MATTAVLPPDHPLTTAVQQLSPLERLQPKQRAFCVAIAANPTSMASACRSAGYQTSSARYLISNAQVIEGIQEAVRLRRADSQGPSHVISKIEELLSRPDDEGKDPLMGKARLLELWCDIKGFRKAQATPAADSPLTPSSRYAPTPLSIDAAQSALRQLREHNPPESE